MCCSGCERIDAPLVGRYRATIDVAGKELPFLLDVARENDRYVLILPNAGERLRITKVRVEGPKLEARLPGNSTLLVAAGRKKLSGTLTLIDTSGSSHALPLRATLGDTHLFYDESLSDNADVEGRWEVALRTDGDTTAPALALLEQEHDRIVGTLTFASGEQHTLHGQIHDEELQLASLSWSDARVYKLALTANGALEGEAWLLSGERQRVHAKRNSDATRDNAQVRMNRNSARSTT